MTIRGLAIRGLSINSVHPISSGQKSSSNANLAPEPCTTARYDFEIAFGLEIQCKCTISISSWRKYVLTFSSVVLRFKLCIYKLKVGHDKRSLVFYFPLAVFAILLLRLPLKIWISTIFCQTSIQLFITTTIVIHNYLWNRISSSRTNLWTGSMNLWNCNSFWWCCTCLRMSL